MGIGRIARHLVEHRWRVRRVFRPRVLANIEAAIKAGDELSQGEMRALFIALGDTRLPAHDVHGRSTIVQLSWDELERRFGRR